MTEWQVGTRKVDAVVTDVSENDLQASVRAYDGIWSWVWWKGYTYRLKPLAREKNENVQFVNLESCIRAPMTGKIIGLFTKRGAKVEKGETLVKMEAMKMQYSLVAPIAGRVKECLVRMNSVVESEELLVEIEPMKAK